MKFSIAENCSIAFAGWVFVVRRKLPIVTNSVKRTVAIPMASSAFVGRILHDSWLVNKYETTGDIGSLELSAAQGRRLVRVDLGPGDAVSLKIKHLIFWSKKISLTTRINLSAAHFASGMNFVQVAKGPGTIIFEISGDPALISDQSDWLPPDRLVAWSADAKFMVSGAHTYFDTYFNGPMVRIAPGATGVMDSDDGASRNWKSVWGIVKRFYWG